MITITREKELKRKTKKYETKDEETKMKGADKTDTCQLI